MAALPIQVNLIPGYNHVPPIVKLNQYEYGFTRQFEVYYGDVPYTIPGQSSVKIEGTKPDRTGYSYTDGISFSGNTITVTIQKQMTVIAGYHMAELVICPSDTKRVSTINIKMDVEVGALNETTDISSSELPDIIDAARSHAEAAALSEANAHASEVAAAASATTAHTSEVNAVGSATAAATSATNAANSATAAAASAQGILDHEQQTRDYMNAAETYANEAALYAGLTVPGLRIDPITMNLIEDDDIDRLYFTYDSSNGQLSYTLTS